MDRLEVPEFEALTAVRMKDALRPAILRQRCRASRLPSRRNERLVSHQPPLYYGDRTFNLDSGRVEHAGSCELLDAIERVRPKVVICGHVLGGFGRFEHQGISIYNVSVVDESYRFVNPATVDLPDVCHGEDLSKREG